MQNTEWCLVMVMSNPMSTPMVWWPRITMTPYTTLTALMMNSGTLWDVTQWKQDSQCDMWKSLQFFIEVWKLVQLNIFRYGAITTTPYGGHGVHSGCWSSIESSVDRPLWLLGEPQWRQDLICLQRANLASCCYIIITIFVAFSGHGLFFHLVIE